VKESAEASAWIEQAKAAYSGNTEFGSLASSVIWSETIGPDGKQLVPVDPDEIVAGINANGYPLLKGHDPGFPKGKVLTAATFTTADGSKFIAALLGLYQGKHPLGFSDLGIESAPVATSPPMLPTPPSCWIEFQCDPREIDEGWIKDILDAAPLPVEREELSHNAAEAAQELLRLGLLFMTLVWNPFVTAVATEAGKDTYATLREWIRKLLGKLAERKNPVLEIQSHHDGCYVSFIFRGNDIKRHYAAHDALPLAAAQAATLIVNMKKLGVPAQKLVYEFHAEDDIWFPSFAELEDGRFITDNKTLIAAEKLPVGLSLGISLGKPKQR
jgi:hypothetical protein